MRPSVVIVAGPNGAGKSTIAPALLHGALAVDEFVNADVIARGLSAFDPESVAITAGRVMLTRLHELAEKRVSFAFETTLASRTFTPCRWKPSDAGIGQVCATSSVCTSHSRRRGSCTTVQA